MTDTDFDENDISELRDYRELNMALMTSQPIWPNGWCQNVAIVAYTIKTEREKARAQDSRCVELLEAAKDVLNTLKYADCNYHVDTERLRKAIAAFEGGHENDPHEFGAGIEITKQALYWRNRSQVWMRRAIELGWDAEASHEN